MPLPEQLFWRGRRLNYVRKAGALGCVKSAAKWWWVLRLFKRATTDTVPLFFFFSFLGIGTRAYSIVFLYIRYIDSFLPRKNVYTGTRCVISFEATHTHTPSQSRVFFSLLLLLSLSFPSSFLYIHIYLYIYMGASAVQAMDCWAVRIAGRNTLFPAWGPRDEEWR